MMMEVSGRGKEEGFQSNEFSGFSSAVGVIELRWLKAPPMRSILSR